MLQSINAKVTLNNGVEMPVLGFGVFLIHDLDQTRECVRQALEVGYRNIDTAFFYGNESAVGDAVRQSGIKREDVFITTKLWNYDQGYDKALKAFDKSMDNLKLDYLDLYLIHWPVPSIDKYVETWRALERLYKEKRVRAIGVSNFLQEHVERLLNECEIVPTVDQVEYHPYLQPDDLLKFLNERNIYLEAWSPLARGQAMAEKTIVDLADKYGKTPAQVILRWEIQKNILVIPKSVTPERIAANAQIFDFELTPEEMAAMNALSENRRLGPDPAVMRTDADKA